MEHGALITSHIVPLSPSVVNKIAAGEVIERPASVVKELVENSLDAGATRIDVAVEGGGCELIRVVDDGCGIPAEELTLAVTCHATSKIRDADDLFRVETLGFRGEALASIAEVSRLELRSRVRDSSGGAALEVVAGDYGEVVPCGCPIGTTVEVRNLLFNTPVRRKFLKAPQTELGHVSEAFTRLALAHPRVHFTLRHNERTVQDLPAGEDSRERIARLFGSELSESLIAVDSREGEVRLSGHVAHPSQSRNHPRMQYLFLNGRNIRDRSLQHALGEAYRGLLLTGRYPIAFLSIDLPPDQVDVNVHPTKAEVRFQDGGRLYGQLLGTLRTRFLTTDLTSRFQPTAETGPASAHDPSQADDMRQELVRWAQGQVAAWDQQQAAPGGMPLSGPPPFSLENRPPLDLHPVPPLGSSVATSAAAGFVPSAALPATARENAGWQASRPVPALQVHNKYLIAESDEGIEVIDQHALHERILYEQLRAKVLGGAVESQSLLVPEPVDCSPAEAAAALENQELLAQLGIQIRHFGGGTILVAGYPAMLSNMPPAEMLRAALERLLGGGKTLDRRDLLDDLLHMISCKAAIKAGDRLTPEEIAALLTQRHLARDAHHCPHGRPTALTFSREELDKQFKRT